MEMVTHYDVTVERYAVLPCREVQGIEQCEVILLIGTNHLTVHPSLNHVMQVMCKG